MSNFARRRDELRRLLLQKSLPNLLVTAELNVTYLTGFTGDSSYLLLAADRELLITDGRYTQQLAEECPGLELAVRGPGISLPVFAADVASKLELPALAIEADHVSVSFCERLKGALKSAPIANTSNLVESLRQIKDEDEIAEIREAIAIAERAFLEIRQSLESGQTEKQVADELEYAIRVGGGTCGAFPSIVGVGPRGALPHGRPARNSRIGDFDFVLFDWGARARQYHSDLTRVVVTGKLAPQLETIYGLVLNAQRAAISAIRPGALMKDVDAAARQVIESAGHGTSFNHALGHGIGLAVHELPRLAADQKKPLAPGMVLTVEPGIYVNGWGGVRIEDDCLVTADGCEVLSTLPKTLESSLHPL
jgi:Xaa-Pro aminopeptidase